MRRLTCWKSAPATTSEEATHLAAPIFSSLLDDLLAQSGKVFLLGAGCSKCAGLPLTADLTTQTLLATKLDTTTKAILTAITEQFTGAPTANIEDYLSELVDLLAIAERRTLRGAASNTAKLDAAAYSATQLTSAIAQIKLAIAAVTDQTTAMETHLNFIRAVHRPLRPGRNIATRPVDYLILNYDTLIESVLALDKLRYADGMCGGSCAWWDSATFSQEGLAARVLKLHGSIDWTEIPGDPMPRRIPESCAIPGRQDKPVLIWPASTKYREAQRDPYAHLVDLARRILHPETGKQLVLVICGYSFSDSHINIEIDRALRDSGGELTIIVFTADDLPVGELKKWQDDPAVADQVRIYARQGFFHGTVRATSAVDLPWWKFENITRLIGGER